MKYMTQRPLPLAPITNAEKYTSEELLSRINAALKEEDGSGECALQYFLGELLNSDLDPEEFFEGFDATDLVQDIEHALLTGEYDRDSRHLLLWVYMSWALGADWETSKQVKVKDQVTS
jgi:hypothetical protein